MYNNKIMYNFSFPERYDKYFFNGGWSKYVN